jgi:hypothetical protein
VETGKLTLEDIKDLESTLNQLEAGKNASRSKEAGRNDKKGRRNAK